MRASDHPRPDGGADAAPGRLRWRRRSVGSGSEGVSLTIWADDKYSRATKESAARWGELNDVQVNVQAVSKDLQTVFVTAAQSGKGPDRVMGAHDWIGNLIQNGTTPSTCTTTRPTSSWPASSAPRR